MKDDKAEKERAVDRVNAIESGLEALKNAPLLKDGIARADISSLISQYDADDNIQDDPEVTTRWYDASDITDYVKLMTDEELGGYGYRGGEYDLQGRLLKQQYLLNYRNKEANFILVTPSIDVAGEASPIDTWLDKAKQRNGSFADHLETLIPSLNEFDQTNDAILIEQLAKIIKGDTPYIKKIINELKRAGFADVALRDKIEELDIRADYRDVFDEVMPKMAFREEATAQIVFPYNRTNMHWLVGEIVITKQGANYKVAVYTHDPYGHGKMIEANFNIITATIARRIKEEHSRHLNSEAVVECENRESVYGRRQAFGDGSSCGVITVEDIIKRIKGESLGQEGMYEAGARELRKKHIKKFISYLPITDATRESFIRRNQVALEPSRITLGTPLASKKIEKEEIERVAALINGIRNIELKEIILKAINDEDSYKARDGSYLLAVKSAIEERPVVMASEEKPKLLEEEDVEAINQLHKILFNKEGEIQVNDNSIHGIGLELIRLDKLKVEGKGDEKDSGAGGKESNKEKKGSEGEFFDKGAWIQALTGNRTEFKGKNLAFNYNVNDFIKEKNIRALLDVEYARLTQQSIAEVNKQLNVMIIIDARRVSLSAQKTERDNKLRLAINNAIKGQSTFFLIDDGLHWASVGLLVDSSNPELTMKIVGFYASNRAGGQSFGNVKELRCMTTGSNFVVELYDQINKSSSGITCKIKIAMITINCVMRLGNCHGVLAAFNMAAFAAFYHNNKASVHLDNFRIWLEAMPFIRILCNSTMNVHRENPANTDDFQEYVRAHFVAESSKDMKPPKFDSKDKARQANERSIELELVTREEIQRRLNIYKNHDEERINNVTSKDWREYLERHIPKFSIGMLFDMIERHSRANNIGRIGPYVSRELRFAVELLNENDDQTRMHFDNPGTSPKSPVFIKNKKKLIDSFEFSSESTRDFPFLRDSKMWNDIPRLAVITGKNGSGKSQLLKCINLKHQSKEVLYLDVTHRLDSVYNMNMGQSFNDPKQIESYVNEVYRHFVSNTPIRNPICQVAVDRINHNMQVNKSTREEINEEYIRSIIVSTPVLDTGQFRMESPFAFIKHILVEHEFRKANIKTNTINTLNILELFSFYSQEFSSTHKLSLEDFIRRISNEEAFRNYVLDQYAEYSSCGPHTKPPLEVINQIIKRYNVEFSINLQENSSNNWDIILTNDKGQKLRPDQLSSGQIVIVSMVAWLYYHQGLTTGSEQEFRQIDNTVKVMLLDEPDRHLDPELCKLFFSILYEEFVKRQGVQVIMTTHRTDTVALSPEDDSDIAIFTLKSNKPGIAVERCNKLQAMFRLTHNMRALTNLHFKVYAESTNDAKFYEGVYHALLGYCNEVREGIKSEGEYNWRLADNIEHRLLSRRYQLSFYSVSMQKDGKPRGDGGCTVVKHSVLRDVTALDNLSKRENAVPVRWKTTKKLLHHPELYSPYGILDNDYGYDWKLAADGLEGRVEVLKRHSLENFIFDPFVLCAALTDQEIAEFISVSKVACGDNSTENHENEGDLISACMNVKYALTTDDFENLQYSLEAYFKILFSTMIGNYHYRRDDKKKPEEIPIYKSINTKLKKGDVICDHNVAIIMDAQNIIKVMYPKEFLSIRGHDIEEFFLDKRGKAQFNVVDIVTERVYQEGIRYIPLDLAEVFFGLNDKLRANLNAVIKPQTQAHKPASFAARIASEREHKGQAEQMTSFVGRVNLAAAPGTELN